MTKPLRKTSIGLAGGLAALLFSACSYHQHTLVRHYGSNASITLTLSEQTSEAKGTWKSEGDPLLSAESGREAWLALTLTDPENRSTFMTTVPKSDLRGFSVATGDPERKPALWFAIEREAGALKFLGQREGRNASGTFTFTNHAAFAEQAGGMLAQVPAPKEWLLAALNKVTLADLRAIKKAGYWTTLPEIIRLRQGGVTADYLGAFAQAGFHFPIDDLIQLRRAGVMPEYGAQLKKAGVALSAQDFIKLRRAAFAAVEVAEWAAAGYTFTTDELVMLRRAGVAADHGAALRKAGFRFSAEDLVLLRRAGVPSELIVAAKAAGYNLSCDDLIKLRRAGVTTDYLGALQAPGRAPVPVDTIIDLRRRGVPPETLKQLR